MDCCDDLCIRNAIPSSLESQRQFIRRCLEDFSLIDNKIEYENYLRVRIRNMFTKRGPTGYQMKRFAIGTENNINCCMKLFLAIYGLKKTKFYDLVTDIKQGRTIGVCDQKRSLPINLNKIVKNGFFDTKFSYDEAQALAVGKHQKSKKYDAIVWMESYFHRVGDRIPNAIEIHLDSYMYKSIFMDYETSMKELMLLPNQYYSYSTFYKVWQQNFPYVKLRKFKQVTGKCLPCARLTDLKNGAKTREELDAYLEAEAAHKSNFSMERKAYHSRRIEAVDYKDDVCSIIFDGMAQNHCELPYLANMKQCEKRLQQHIQGVKVHGRFTNFYVTYHNVAGGADLTIHCFLDTLQDILKKYGSIPRKVYVQMDGGSENANKTFLAMCEWLCAVGVVDKIIVTRLPVGHTHEDIDACFGTIWSHLKGLTVTTPFAYLIEIANAFRSQNVFVKQVFAFANFTALLEKNIKTIQRWRSGLATQLQFIFTRLEESCEAFPNKSKVQYRAYSCDRLKEVLFGTGEEYKHGCRIIETHVHTFPTENKAGGFTLLKEIPRNEDSLRPRPFVPGSRKELESVVRFLKEKILSHNTWALSQWDKFLDIAPADDNAERYSEYYVPLKDLLFEKQFSMEIQSERSSPVSSVAEYSTVDSVIYDGNPGDIDYYRVRVDGGDFERKLFFPKKEKNNQGSQEGQEGKKDKEKKRKRSKDPVKITDIRHNVISTKQMEILESKDAWIDDEIVNFYFGQLSDSKNKNAGNLEIWYLKTQFMAKFFPKEGFNYNYVKSWSERAKVRVGSLESLFIPIHVNNNHWTLAVVDIPGRMISYYDSARNKGGTYFEAISEYLKRETNIEEWKCITVEEGPIQADSHNCGIFVMMTAYYLTRMMDVSSIKSSETLLYRKYIKYSILNGVLVEFEEFRTKSKVDYEGEKKKRKESQISNVIAIDITEPSTNSNVVTEHSGRSDIVAKDVTDLTRGSDDASEEANELTAYEILRRENMRRNAAFLQSIGLMDTAETMKKSQKRKKTEIVLNDEDNDDGDNDDDDEYIANEDSNYKDVQPKRSISRRSKEKAIEILSQPQSSGEDMELIDPEEKVQEAPENIGITKLAPTVIFDSDIDMASIFENSTASRDHLQKKYVGLIFLDKTAVTLKDGSNKEELRKITDIKWYTGAADGIGRHVAVTRLWAKALNEGKKRLRADDLADYDISEELVAMINDCEGL